MTTLTLIISGQTLVISGEGLTVEVRTNSSGKASETIDGDEFATDKETGHVDRSAERASSAVKVGATNSPERATKQRVMSMTPLEPREANGLKGFGFTVNFEDSNTSKPILPGQLDVAGAEPPPSVPATLSAVPAAETTGENEPQQLVSPVALIKPRAPLRPKCLNPSECAGYGTKTCHRCTLAAERPAA